MAKPVLGYWDFRGLAQDIRCLLTYLKVDFEDKRYPPGPDFGDDHWLAEKFGLGLDFPNVPYWIDGDVKLTESRAILKYLARSKDASLIPSSDLLQARAETLEGVALDMYMALVRNLYSANLPTEPLETTLTPKFQQVEAFLGANKFSLGDQLYWIDFFLYEVLKQFSKFSPKIFDEKPAIRKYIRSFESIPQLQEYFNSARVKGDVCLSRKGRVVF